MCTDPSAGCIGGYSRVKTVIDKTRPTHKNSLFLNAGDEFQGTLFYTVYGGEKIAATLNQLGFDGMTLVGGTVCAGWREVLLTGDCAGKSRVRWR